MVAIARWKDAASGEPRSGFVADEQLVELPEGLTSDDLVERGLEFTLDLAKTVLAAQTSGGPPLSEVELLPPVTPASLRDFVAFEEHVEGVRKSIDGEAGVAPEWYRAPTFYFTNPHTTHGHGSEVPIPGGSQAMDFETELALVVGPVEGSDGTDLDLATAGKHIFGYTILNDLSARDLQSREMKVSLGPCKGKDFANVLGPVLVTADEFEAGTDADGFVSVTMEAFVNGERVGQDNLRNIGWPLPELVRYASLDSVVKPRDVLGSGTCGNGGCLAELWGRDGDAAPGPLQPGDEVELRIEGIGSLRTRIGERKSAHVLTPAAARPRTRD